MTDINHIYIFNNLRNRLDHQKTEQEYILCICSIKANSAFTPIYPSLTLQQRGIEK